MRIRTAVTLCALALLVSWSSLAASGPAMLRWYAMITCGGGAASSSHYGAQLTIGQAPAGSAASSGYRAHLGYAVLPPVATLTPTAQPTSTPVPTPTQLPAYPLWLPLTHKGSPWIVPSP
jgi:hypothetical protein